MLAAWSRLVTRHAAIILILIAALTALSIASFVDFRAVAEQRWLEALRIPIDPSQSSMLPREDEGKLYYDKVRAIFGNDETLLLTIERSEGIFHPQTLDAIARITRRIEDLPQVRSVMSIANAPDVRGVEGDLIVAPLYEGPVGDQAAADLVRERLAENPILDRNVVNADGTAAIIVVYLLDLSELEFTVQEVDRRILALAEEEIGPLARVWLSGSPHIKAETSRGLARDLGIVIPLAFVVMMLVALVAFRTVRGVVIPVLTIGIAVIWMLGAATLLVSSLNIVTTSVPAILLAIGFAYAIHVVSTYYDEVRAGGEGTAARRALEHVGVPTLLTGLTTSVGFGSLATSPLSAIREFGVLAAVGVAATMVACMTFAPALLELLPEKAPPGRDGRSDLIDRLLGRLALFDVRHRRLVLATGALAGLLSLLAMSRIEISTNLLDNFAKGTPIRERIDATARLIGAADQVYVILETDYRDAFKEPVNLALVEDIQAFLAAQPEVGGVVSLADHVKLINQGFNENDPAFHRIPDSRRMVSQLLFFGASDDVERLVNSHYRVTSLPVRIDAVNSKDVVAFAERVDERLAALPEHVTGRITGNSILIARTNDDIAYGQALSVGTAFVIIFGMLSILFASLRVGALAMIPNLLPVLIYFGALGWTGITLNVVTGLVACLVLGIAVDDTIHMLTRFNALAKEHADEEVGVKTALAQVGRAVTYTSLALCLGFSVIAASSLQQQVEFGLLSAFTLAVAWVIDVTFTPALACGMRIVTLFEVLGVDLGEDPQHAIPLFHGLSAGQARIAALMTDIVEVPAGQRVFSLGTKDEGDMFVVLEGELTAHVNRSDGRVELRTHRRGDLVGEVAMFHGERSANVDAVTDARLLRVEQSDLDQLEKRYPRIGSRVFRNLSKALADRLVEVTRRVPGTPDAAARGPSG